MKAEIAIFAFEVSSDKAGSELAKELANMDFRLFGFGGEYMRKAGVDVLFNPTPLATSSAREAIRSLKQASARLKDALKILSDKRVLGTVFVDFTLHTYKVATLVKKRGIKTAVYIGPHFWAFNRDAAKVIMEPIDLVITTTCLEEEFYRSFKRTAFVGHPIAFRVARLAPKSALRAKLKIGLSERVLALLPGSRFFEIKTLGQVAVKVANGMVKRGFSVAIPVASEFLKDAVLSLASEIRGKTYIFPGNLSLEVLKASDLAVVSAGTSTLEAFLCGTPAVCVYKIPSSSMPIIRLLATAKFISIPNNIANRLIMPEILNENLSAENVVKALLDERWKGPYLLWSKKVLEKLLSSYPAKRAAKAIVSFFLEGKK